MDHGALLAGVLSVGNRPQHQCVGALHKSAVMCTNTNHDRQKSIGGQFLFNHEYAAINSDTSSDIESTYYTPNSS